MTNDDMSVVWSFIGALFAFKFVTSIFILYYFPSWHTVLFLAVLSTAWFVPPIYYLARNPRGRFRLLRARVRRGELLRQEWEVEEHHPQHRA